MAIRFDTMKTESVPLPVEPERKVKAEPRVSLASKLTELIPNVGDSTFVEDGKKTNVDQAINSSKKRGTLVGKFKTVEFEAGKDSVHSDKAGVRIWRTEVGGNVTQLQAAE